MDAPNAPREKLSPPESAPGVPEGAGHAPSTYRDAPLGSEVADGGAGAGQGVQLLDYPTPSQNLANLAEQSAVYATRAFGPGTQRAYRSAWTKYTGWCAEHGLDPFAGAAGPLPLYVTHLAETGRAVSSIRVALAAIATAYRLAGLPLDLRDPKLVPVVVALQDAASVAAMIITTEAGIVERPEKKSGGGMGGMGGMGDMDF